MNKTYLLFKYPQHKLFGFFMYFYNMDSEITAVLDTRDDEIIEEYKHETETLV